MTLGAPNDRFRLIPLLLLIFAAPVPAEPIPQALAAPSERIARLFLDHRIVAHVQGMTLRLAASRSSAANPLLLDGAAVWTTNNIHFTVGRDPAGAWFGWMDEMRPTPKAEDARVTFRLKSQDGLAWKRDGEPIALPSPSAIVIDPADADAGRRFKAVVSGWGELGADAQPTRVLDKARWAAEGGAANARLIRGLFSATSPDGRTWNGWRRMVVEQLPPGKKLWTPGEPGWAGGDNFPCLLFEPRSRKWVAFFRTNIDPGKRVSRRERAIGRAESADFETWSPHELAMRADPARLAALGYGPQDFYQLMAWPAGGGYLGLLSVYYWQEDRVHLELAWSPNTIDWERVCPGSDLIPHGPLHQPGNGCRFGAMSPVTIGDSVRVYWGGDDGKHNANPKRKGCVFLNEFARDRFAGYTVDNPAAGGELITQPLHLSPAGLRLSANTRTGTIRAELRDATGQALPGFSLADSEPLQGDALDSPLKWRGLGAEQRQDADPLQPASKAVTLRLVASGDATVYAVSGIGDRVRPEK